jgi:MOSC domain-containing protein YiiM
MNATNKGRIVSVNVSAKRGVKKSPVGTCRLIKDQGLQGDGHAGFAHRQVSLLAKESIDKMVAVGLNVGPGDFAENLTTEAIDLVSLPIGTILRAGSEALLRVTQIGKECHTRCAIYYQAGDCVMPKEGIFAEVLREGTIKIGDELEVVD